MTAAARRVLCLSGSLRRVSANTAALEAVRQLAPPTLNSICTPASARCRCSIPTPTSTRCRRRCWHCARRWGAPMRCSSPVPEYAHGVPGAFKPAGLAGRQHRVPGKPVCAEYRRARFVPRAGGAGGNPRHHVGGPAGGTAGDGGAAGAGCSAAQVLASAARCEELRAALDVLAEALPVA
ncbi:FMN reductase [Rhodanobacter lindaniclasticus]